MDTAKEIDDDIKRSIVILKSAGCTEIYIFGSAAEGRMHEGSDIDIAVRGLPEGVFFKVLAQLMSSLSRPVDLMRLDDSPFAGFLEHHGKLTRVA